MKGSMVAQLCIWPPALEMLSWCQCCCATRLGAGMVMVDVGPSGGERKNIGLCVSCLEIPHAFVLYFHKGLQYCHADLHGDMRRMSCCDNDPHKLLFQTYSKHASKTGSTIWDTSKASVGTFNAYRPSTFTVRSFVSRFFVLRSFACRLQFSDLRQADIDATNDEGRTPLQLACLAAAVRQDSSVV